MSYSRCTILVIMVFSAVLPFISSEIAPSTLTLAPHCSGKCGNVSIPYPFGIEEGCYFVDKDNPFMKITCNHSDSRPTPIFGSNLDISNISLEGEIRFNQYISYNCYNQSESIDEYNDWINMETFTISRTQNVFVAVGCDTYAWFSGIRHGKKYDTGCMTKCNDVQDVVDGECNGVGCCEASVPDGITNITTTVSSFSNHSSVSFNPCSIAFPVAKDSFKFTKKSLTQDSDYYFNDGKHIPVVFNWAVGTKNCSIAQADGTSLCKNNTICHDAVSGQAGYVCKCKDGYVGNPFLPQGCQDINECKGANECERAEYCINTDGSYSCTCPKGYHGNGTKSQGCTSSEAKAWFAPVIITAGIGAGIITLLIVGFLLHWRNGKRQLKELRESLFRRNGGSILQQKLSEKDHHELKIFTALDLEIATEYYRDENIVGRGGFGVVYKGTMPNNQVVAIKKSLKVDPDQVEQFINEVLILSQINNRNIVKLVGCCLETEVPLLVYEYINNGTLYEHLDDEDKASLVTWPIRLRIASEIAHVLSYLHYTIATPIIHRDMKSMNILLDQSYTAKVSDFGASRLVPVDQGQLATMVLGTWGYLDPEYMQTSELNEKSDVYSFGVVLVELLTRKKAVSLNSPETERCLAMHFLIKMKEHCLFDIIDKTIINEEEIEQIKLVANLAKWCLKLKGEERPTMREVAMELEGIKRTGTSTHPWYKAGSIEQVDCESLLGISHDSDGFTGGTNSDLYNLHSFAAPLGNGR